MARRFPSDAARALRRGVACAVHRDRVLLDLCRAARRPVRSFLVAPFTGRTWREGVYLFTSSLLSGASLAPVGMLLGPGVLLAVLAIVLSHDNGALVQMVGIVGAAITLVCTTPLLALVLLGVRQVSAVVHRGLAAALLRERVPEPPARRPARGGLFGWLRWSLGDGVSWRALAFLLASAPLTTAGLYIALLGTVVGVVSATYPLWWHLFSPTNTDADGVVHHSGMQFGDYYIDTWPRALMVAGAGVVLLFAVPWIVRGVVWVDRLLVRNLLGPERTSARLRDLEETRAQVVDDSAATLRRIERDLHDGTQARLVALAMQLDMAREELVAGQGGAGDGAGDHGEARAEAGAPAGHDDPVQRARKLVETAHRNATEAITELREVTRSIHPPILDRGLDAALATLTAGSAVPTLLHTDIRTRPSAAIETIAYFCVAELLANVAKHSRARQASVSVVAREDGRLRIQVGDDGVGGAQIREARGLAGLADRLRTVDGRLTIDSPSGGPTLVTVDLPTSS